MKNKYRFTVRAAYLGYVVLAIINNLAPLLFVTLQDEFSIELSKITLLITVNYGIQFVVDFLSAFVVDRIGYRPLILFANATAFAGLVMLTFMPSVMPDPYVGILLSVCVYAFGSGLIEVLISPIVEACPNDNKEGSMSLLHSAFCWGHVCVVLLSTLFFVLFGTENWRYLTLAWAIVPVIDFIAFCKVPMLSLAAPEEERAPVGRLFLNKTFLLFLVMTFCAGAAELSVSQWSSVFAERGLGVSKTVGDLAGPMAFAAFMGASRTIFGKYGEKLNLDRFMKFSCVLCIASYLCITLVPSPVIGLIGCAICGFSVGIFWPGCFSKAAVALRGSGTALFSFLALAGDVGASAGPTLAGFVSSVNGDDLHVGILAAIGFPVVLLICLYIEKAFSANGKRKEKTNRVC